MFHFSSLAFFLRLKEPQSHNHNSYHLEDKQAHGIQSTSVFCCLILRDLMSDFIAIEAIVEADLNKVPAWLQSISRNIKNEEQSIY